MNMRFEDSNVSMTGTMLGTRAIVTGGAQGMGREHSLELLRRGASVGVLDVDSEALDRFQRELEMAGSAERAILIQCDVSNRERVESAVAEIADRFGGIDALVSNAGNIHEVTGILDTDDENWDRTLAIHVGGARNLVRAAIPHVRQSQTPRIVVVSSMWAQRGPGFGYAYCAAKGALIALTKNLAVELGPDGILVNAIAPGSVPTRMSADYAEADIEEDARSIPLGRWAEANEMSRLVCFLASDQASYLTGQLIAINGGQIIASF